MEKVKVTRKGEENSVEHEPDMQDVVQKKYLQENILKNKWWRRMGGYLTDQFLDHWTEKIKDRS